MSLMMKLTKLAAGIALALILLAACKSEPPKPPRGYWELRGDANNGLEAIFRLSVDGGPFIRYLGMAPPPGKLMTHKEYQQMLGSFDRYWVSLPEMLTKYDNGKFIGIGSLQDGKVMFEYNPKTQEILSHQPGSEGLWLKRVTFFEPLKFPKFEEKSAKAGLAGWGANASTNAP